MRERGTMKIVVEHILKQDIFERYPGTTCISKEDFFII